MKRKLQITGRGKLSVTPDIIILSFEAMAQEWEYGKTINTLNRKVEELRQIMTQQGLERSSLKTKGFGILKETTWNKKTERHEFNGFRATHSLELELPLDKTLINSLLSQLAKRLDNLDFGIAFGVKDPSGQQQKLILDAIHQAKESAALIAGATGVELLEILHIDYSFRELLIRSQRHDYPLYEADAMSTYDAAPDFEPDDIDLTETVTITWRIG